MCVSVFPSPYYESSDHLSTQKRALGRDGKRGKRGRRPRRWGQRGKGRDKGEKEVMGRTNKKKNGKNGWGKLR